MVNIELNDLIEIVIDNMEEFSASGHMAKEGASFFETPYELVAIYDTVAVIYIIFQEESFEHWITGEIVDKNEGFISVKAVGKIQKFVWSEVLGIPYDKEANEDVLEQMGSVKDI